MVLTCASNLRRKGMQMNLIPDAEQYQAHVDSVQVWLSEIEHQLSVHAQYAAQARESDKALFVHDLIIVEHDLANAARVIALRNNKEK